MNDIHLFMKNQIADLYSAGDLQNLEPEEILGAMLGAVLSKIGATRKGNPEYPEFLPELMPEVDTNCPEIIGQMIMGHLDPEGEKVRDKVFWLKLAEHIGPDYAQGLYHAAVFTTKVA